jgi:choice-of-anchor C domain-containing protein
MSLTKIIATAALVAGISTAAAATTVTNGGFEDPGTFNGPFTTIGTGSSALTGWNITRGNVDLINTFWQHSAGSYSIDLDGNRAATISQTISGLTVGKKYNLTFDLASNGTATKSLTAAIGQTSQVFSFVGTGTTYTNMGWLGQSLTFTAENTSLLLSFASNSPTNSNQGAALDNVAIAPVPLPAALPLLLVGLGGLAGLRRRKKAA